MDSEDGDLGVAVEHLDEVRQLRGEVRRLIDEGLDVIREHQASADASAVQAKEEVVEENRRLQAILQADLQRAGQLEAEVRRLREENTQHVGVAAKVILENQRLREEIGRLDRRVSGVQALGRLNAKLTEERDALAAQLREVAVALGYSSDIVSVPSCNTLAHAAQMITQKVGSFGQQLENVTRERDSLASLLETVLRSCRAEDRGRMAPSHELLDTIATVLACVRGEGAGDV